MMSAIRKAVLVGVVVLGMLGFAGCGLGDILGRNTPTPTTPDFDQLVPDAWTN